MGRGHFRPLAPARSTRASGRAARLYSIQADILVAQVHELARMSLQPLDEVRIADNAAKFHRPDGLLL
jgi:hypothetical protein